MTIISIQDFSKSSKKIASSRIHLRGGYLFKEQKTKKGIKKEVSVKRLRPQYGVKGWAVSAAALPMTYTVYHNGRRKSMVENDLFSYLSATSLMRVFLRPSMIYTTRKNNQISEISRENGTECHLSRTSVSRRYTMSLMTVRSSRFFSSADADLFSRISIDSARATARCR